MNREQIKDFFKKYGKYVYISLIAIVVIVLLISLMAYSSKKTIRSANAEREKQEALRMQKEIETIENEQERVKNLISSHFENAMFPEISVQKIDWTVVEYESYTNNKTSEKDFVFHKIKGHSKVGFENIKVDNNIDFGTKTITFFASKPTVLSTEVLPGESERKVVNDSQKVVNVQDNPAFKKESPYQKAQDEAKKLIVAETGVFAQAEKRLKLELKIIINTILGDDWNVNVNIES